MYRALECPLTEDLAPLSRFLRAQGTVHRISEERGLQVVWTLDEADALVVRRLHADGVPALSAAFVEQPAQAAPGLLFWLRHAPLTMFLVALCLLVAVLTGLGDRIDALVWFTVTPPVGPQHLQLALDLQQPWRLFTPILIHFSLLHLAFNMLWLWELGRRVELRSGGFWLLGLLALFALVSNLAQLLVSGNPWFGGMSGVLYGLLGYCWLYQWLAPNHHFDLPKGVVVLMLVWLLLCLSGLVTLAGFGAIANTAHVSGLLAGCAAGLAAGALARNRSEQ
ncbi:rhomboid family intramembrane serine protease [Halopseudomonas yangmingensis]|uniref:GlpG protein n=1 Tax=Halopseudomonas yangmingensis TaxID=1720063 RepID=A0A1I4Q0Z6_9GAMM|nr:rhomboid family intramembrane serine protease [Halopseudomonas yangmingensis]SFM33727.1 GlpG protein [Halopseudomonas yangmingensis]